MNAAEVLTFPRLTAAARYRRRATVAGAALAFTGLVALRLRTMHQGLLYPDGYQYLLMARGIGQHLQPVAHLGHGGDMVAPSTDAAAKPLFPALVSVGELLRLSSINSARAVAALAGAAVAPLAGLVTLRLGASRIGAILAAALCLASPTLGFWLGFAGPEGLAEALALATTLAFLYKRPVLGGVLAGLAVTARPELLALALGAALAGAASPVRRHDAVAGATAGLATFALVIGVLRPPLSADTLALLPAAAGLGCLVALGLVLVERLSRRACAGVLVVLATLIAVGIATGSAWASLAARDWALLALAAAGLAAAISRPESRARALRVTLLTLTLALAYYWKNPGSERYLAVLLPAFAIVAGLGITRFRSVVIAGAAALALAGALLASTPSIGPDAFRGIAARLEHGPAGPLVTAAPDAYGVLLPRRAVRMMRPGATGLVLVDGAARAYDPQLRVVGRLVERIPATVGFLRPDGRLDDAPALLYRGSVRASR